MGYRFEAVKGYTMPKVCLSALHERLIEMFPTRETEFGAHCLAATFSARVPMIEALRERQRPAASH